MRVLNKHHFKEGWPPGAVDITRRGPFGNPFVIGRDGTRDDVCEKHMRYLRDRVAADPKYRDLVRTLLGHDLMCVCAPYRCHGENLKIVCVELNK